MSAKHVREEEGNIPCFCLSALFTAIQTQVRHLLYFSSSSSFSQISDLVWDFS